MRIPALLLVVAASCATLQARDPANSNADSSGTDSARQTSNVRSTAALKPQDQTPATNSTVTPAPQATPTSDPFVRLEGGIKALGDKGVLFQVNYTGEEFANLSGGLRTGASYEGLLKIGVNLDLEKLLHWKGATFYASMLYPHGNGLTSRYVGDIDVLSNIDAYDSLRLFELWLEQSFADGRFSIRVGQITTDNIFFTSTNSSLFINSAFGTIGNVSLNVMAPAYPVGSLGVLLRYKPTSSFYMEAMVADGNPGAQDGNDNHGTRFDLSRSSGALTFFEAGYLSTIPAGKNSLAGSYKLGGFFDSGFYAGNTPGSGIHHGNWGIYAVVDQQLYCAPASTADAFQGLGVFARIGYSPDDRNLVTGYLDTGLNYTGLFPSRPKDIFGIACSLEKFSNELTDPATSLPVPSHRENVFEVTYVANLTDYLSLQPDFQYIVNPGGTGTTRNALVAGLRFSINF